MRRDVAHSTAGAEGSRAVVIGGSIAGLLAARVLADHFDHVTIVERDRYPAAPAPRAGVPQSPHLHALLARGLGIFETLFHGIREELVDAGANVLEAGQDIAWLTPAGWGVRYSSGLKILAFSRPLLDWTVRRRVAALPNVAVLEGCDVTGLMEDEAGEVAGVLLRRRGDGELAVGAPTLRADLVVDASGRNSRAPEWLEAIGYARPEETVINAFLGYSSRFYDRPRGERVWKATFIQAAPPERTRGGLLFPVEGGRWLVTLIGGGGDYPPTDEAGFEAFAETLASPALRDALREAAPLSVVAGHRGTENRRRHYERAARWPERLVVLGDAACAFNPVYGQGMTVAAMEAEALAEALSGRPGGAAIPRGFAKRFQRRIAKIVELPWALATSEDCRYRETEGATPGPRTRVMQRYVDEVVALTTYDAETREVWIRVFNMIEPPSRLLGPKILARVVRRLLGRRRPGPSHPATRRGAWEAGTT